MSILKQAYIYLQKIKDKEVSFTHVLNHSLNDEKMPKDDIALLKDTLKSVVNKFYFLNYEVENAIGEVDLLKFEEIEIVSIALAMYHYVKKLELPQIIAYFDLDASFFRKEIEDFSLSSELIADIFKRIGEKPLYIKDDLKIQNTHIVALIYSYPEWIVKMIYKHYGGKHAFKIIASSRSSIHLVVNYNPMLISPDKLDPAIFQKNPYASTSYSYLAKEKIVDLKLFNDNKIFVEDEASQLIIDKLNPTQTENILLMDESKGLFTLDTCLRCNDVLKVQTACRDTFNFNNVKKYIKRFKLKSVYPFETNMEILITHVPYESFDKVLINPVSSSLGLIRKRPDILLTLKQSDLDGLIENEKYELEEGSKFVKKGGILIYCTFTLNTKENEGVVHDFLSKPEHKEEYSLLEENTYFPYKTPLALDGCYIALLKRGL